MTQSATLTMEPRVESPEAEGRGQDPYFEITDLARTQHSRHGFFGEALEVIGRAFSSPYATLYVETESSVIQEEWAPREEQSALWKGRVQSFLTESMEKWRARAQLLSSKLKDKKACVLSSPMIDSSGTVMGALALVVSPVEDEGIAWRLGYLESMTRLACHTAELLNKRETAPARAGSTAEPVAFAHVGSMRNPVEIAFAITNNLRNQLGCEQVALGLTRGHRVRILSVSGMDQVVKGNPGIVPMRMAMEECVDYDAPIVSQSQSATTDDGRA